MKRTRFLAAVLSVTAAFPLLTSMPAVYAVQEPAAAQSAEDPLFGTLPEWVPTNFVEAMEFYNKYGKSHVSDDIICLVMPTVQYMKDNCGFDISGCMTEVDTPCCSDPKFFELEIPEQPDPEDAEAVAAYEAYCDRLGLRSYDYSFFEQYAECRTQHAFEVQLFRVVDGYDLTVTWFEKHGEEKEEKETFEFANAYGYPTEVDAYGWLPDSKPEYDAYLKENGRASVHESNARIVYLADVNGSTGESLKMEQYGKGKFEEELQSNCDPFEFQPLDGSGSHTAILYKPVADGYVSVDWTVGIDWAEEAPKAVTKGTYKITHDCAMTIDYSKGTIFTLVDADSGELIEIPENAEKELNSYFLKYTSGKYKQCVSCYLYSNPGYADYYDAYDPSCSYFFHTPTENGWYETVASEVTSKTEQRTDITWYLRWVPEGDADKDGKFNDADAALLENWLLGKPDITIADPDALDFFHDGKLDARDISLMKQQLMREKPHVVLPERPVGYGAPLWVVADEVKLYAGPDKDYEVVGTMPKDARSYEIGYQSDDDKWLFTEYEGQFGWIRILEDDDKTPTVHFDLMADKPVIYLYPEEETDVHVELELTEADLATTYPKYNDGWDVTAYPDGRLLNKADGTHHRYLFWDAANCRMRYDLSKGFCVAGSDTEQFLKEKLTYMGLTEDEMNEFIVYWLPKMEHNAYNLISFQGEAYTESAKLNITPAPDSMLRVFMTYVPLEEAVNIEPQQLDTFERTGFTVVEWGGTEIGR